ncbi:MAG: hypothetical protein DME26_02810 [Verrucomicrobia bacterium]|nr:MAG: hypothetical protein DME26_02810 [Verrucomicrobiota bacterium]
MKVITKRGSMTLGSAIGRLLTPTLTLVAAAAILLPASETFGGQLDLTGTTTTFDNFFGDGVKFSTVDNQPTGTGVFKPFLTLQNSPIEQGYNTSGNADGSNNRDVFDTKRQPNWNHDIKLGDLQKVDGFYVFELDANETGNGTDSRLLSVDNIVIYGSPNGKQGTEQFDANGILQFTDKKLVYMLNNPNTPTAEMPNWVKIDASKKDGGSTSGSGSSDMLVYIPADYFTKAGVVDSDYVYFYDLNGVHYASEAGTSADAGYEEWSAKQGPNSVPDGGNTLVLFGTAIVALGVLAGRRKLAIVA